MATSQTQKSSQQPANKPVQVFRLRGVKAAVFENKTEQGIFHKISLQRIYREGDEWKTTHSLSRDDVPIARHLLQKAWAFILETEAGPKKEELDE